MDPRGTIGMEALGILVSEKKIFFMFSHCISMGANDPRGGAIFKPRGMIVRNYKENHYTLLHTKHESSGPGGLGDLCPPNRRWGTYCFWCVSRRRRRRRQRPRRRPRPRSFFPTWYLLNQWMDFNQTCIDTWLGGEKELIRLWWPWPYFQGHQPMKTDQIRFSDAISSEQMNGFWPNLHKSIVGRLRNE